MPFTKGETISSHTPLAMLPLFEDETESATTTRTTAMIMTELPRFEPSTVHWRKTVGSPPESKTQLLGQVHAYLRKKLHRNPYVDDPINRAIAASLLLVAQGSHTTIVDKLLRILNGQGDPKDERHRRDATREERQAWKMVHEVIDEDSWVQLVELILRNSFVVVADHPLYTYATSIVPTLTKQERQQVIQSLQLPSEMAQQSVLVMMKHMHDTFQPERYLVMLEPAELEERQQRHHFTLAYSCIPNAQLVLSKAGEIDLVALYDVPENDDNNDNISNISIMPIVDNESVEIRENHVLARTGESCGCLRCRYEVNLEQPQRHQRSMLSTHDLIELARFYLGRGQLESAKELYTKAIAMENNSDKDNKDPNQGSQADVWHALGAIALSQGRFLEAQTIWKNAAGIDNKCNHPGIQLQLEKMQAYGYFSQPSQCSSTSASRTELTPMVDVVVHSPIPSVFITNALDPMSCQEVISLTEAGTWTRTRHYAVPTYDIPIHTNAVLLDWFNRLYQDRILPVLQTIFPTSSGSFFVHDAFCVKYEGTETSNHLPVHVDECTHSFVLALNDCSTYEGGGTYFLEHDTTIRLKAGELLAFRGDTTFHGGDPVSKGARYILAAFLYEDRIAVNDDIINRVPKRRHSHSEQDSFARPIAKQGKTSFSFCFDLSS